MFWVRLRSSVVLMIIAIALLVLGGDVLFVGMALISLIGMMELYRTLKFHKTPLAIAGYVAAIVYYGVLRIGAADFAMAVILAYLVALLAIYVFAFPKYHADQIMAAFFGLFYVAVMISYIYQTRMLESGAYLVWLIFICSWGCDTCAYCVGMLIGKHKMAPVLSPKKSVEGAFGGVFGSMLIGGIYTLIFREQITVFANPIVSVIIISGIGALISMIGDLAASAIKRNHEIKDYGKLIPGHGGILDRFDSVIFTAPILFYLIRILQMLG